MFGLDPQELEKLELDEQGARDEIGDAIWALVKKSYEEKETLVGAELLRRVERDIMLQIVDAQWKDHLYSLDHLKEGIGLRGYGQRDPLVEYKKESFALFQDMKARIEEEMVRYLFWLRPVLNEERARPRPAARRAAPAPMTMNNPAAEAVPAFAGGGRASAAWRRRRHRPGGRGRRGPAATTSIKTVRREEPKVGQQRSVPVRQREEIQEVPRRRGVMGRLAR